MGEKQAVTRLLNADKLHNAWVTACFQFNCGFAVFGYSGDVPLPRTPSEPLPILKAVSRLMRSWLSFGFCQLALGFDSGLAGWLTLLLVSGLFIPSSWLNRGE
ncbi:MAG: hypothetical protein R3D55_07305 [Chloroflexota bacterium]